MVEIFTPDDFQFIQSLVKKAGKVALNIQQSDLAITRKGDSTIVTRADFEVQELLISELSVRFPHAVFIHEENFDRSKRLLNDDTLAFIIDPIDGTAMYSMHLPIWCISIGIFTGFNPLYGFVYSPGSDMFFRNDNDHAYLNDIPVTVDQDILLEKETNIFYASEIPGIFNIDFPGKIRNLGSTALHACLTVDNRRNRVLAFIGEAYLWDWAGAIPIILKAGGLVRYLSGRKPDYREIIENNYQLKEYLISTSSKDFPSIQNIFSHIR